MSAPGGDSFVADGRPPPARLPDPVRADLERHRPGLADAFEATLASLARPCVLVRARRVSPRRLNTALLGRLLGGADPVLGPLESKFGGVPYSEGDEDWKGYRFLGQLDLAAATAVLPEAQRLAGLLRVDLGPSGRFESMRARWFPAPDARRAVAVRPPSVGTHEASLSFELGWTLPDGEALDALWPLPEWGWLEYEPFFPLGYNREGDRGVHRLLGHPTGGFDDVAFTPAEGGSPDRQEHACLLRLPLDGQAGFDWGSNCVYLVVPRDDLARGDLRRVVVGHANS